MVTSILVGVGSVTFALVVLVSTIAGLVVYIRRQFPSDGATQVRVEERLTALELQVKGLPSLWEDERKRAKRAQDAANAARKSAADKLEQIEELIESGEDFRGVNGDSGEDFRMQPVQRHMEVSPPTNLQDRLAAVAHLLT